MNARHKKADMIVAIDFIWLVFLMMHSPNLGQVIDQLSFPSLWPYMGIGAHALSHVAAGASPKILPGDRLSFFHRCVDYPTSHTRSEEAGSFIKR